jgi:uncharacterized protein with HEPN domain
VPAGAGTLVMGSALLQALDASGVAVLTLVEDVSEADLLRSRLTRSEVTRHLQQMCHAATGMPLDIQAQMPEVDWAAWSLISSGLSDESTHARDEALSFAVRSLVSATLMWLRVYRQSHPALFRMAMG